MNKIIKNVLNAIEKKGYEAYIVGGYVRDMLLGISSFDIDICTNATPKELINIFPDSNAKNLGGIDFKIKEYHFEITTYREELKYQNRKPAEYNYVNNLVTDLNRRDFTINSICMNSKGEIIDLLKGFNDLSANKIRLIGTIDTKLTEDPLRLMRAIRLATTLNFNFEENLYKGIIKHYKLVLNLSMTRIKEEFDKILLSPNVKKGLKILSDVGILKLLNITYDNITPISNLEGMYAQLKYTCSFPFTKVEKENINSIKEIIAEEQITPYTLYTYGLYLNTVAGEILNIDKKVINKMYKNLSIHSKKDINIKPETIKKILNIDYGKTISIILNDLENLIIDGKIRNKRSDIVKYIINNKARWLRSE